MMTDGTTRPPPLPEATTETGTGEEVEAVITVAGQEGAVPEVGAVEEPMIVVATMTEREEAPQEPTGERIDSKRRGRPYNVEIMQCLLMHGYQVIVSRQPYL